MSAHENGVIPKEYASAQEKNYNILYQLFSQKFNEIREENERLQAKNAAAAGEGAEAVTKE